MQNKIMLLSGLFIAMVFLSGCTQLTTDSGDAMEKEDGAMEKNGAVEGSAMPVPGPEGVDETVVNDDSGDSMEETGTEPQLREFDMTAKQWEFIPSTITVNEGDTVKLNITSTDVTHGFKLAEFNVNEQLVKETTKIVEFIADKKGTFSFSCSVVCGSGHSTMKGTLIVE